MFLRSLPDALRGRLLPAVAAFALVLAARAVEPLGFVHVEADNIVAPVPDREAFFKVGNTASLFELKNDMLVVFSAGASPEESLSAVSWNRQDAPAWVSNERVVTFGKLTRTIDGRLHLERGEMLPVIAIGQRDFRILVTRFGNTASVDIRRDTPGLRFEEKQAVVVAPPPVAVATSAPAATAATAAGKSRVVIEGSGSMLMIRTNVEQAALVQPPVATTAPPVAIATPPPPVVTTPQVVAAQPAAATNEPEAVVPPLVPPAPRRVSFFADRSTLIVVGFFVAAILVLIQTRSHLKKKRMAAQETPPPAPAPEPPRLRSRSAERAAAAAAAAAAAPSEPPKLKFASSKKNQTIILGQQNLVGSPMPGAPLSASDTAIIPSPSFLPDRRAGGVLWIGKYQVEQLLGRGRMGVVYKAFQQDLNRSVALKLLAEGGHASQKSKERFVKEAQAIARLRHPNIVTVYEVGEWEGQPFFTMDFVDGKSLDKMIVKQRFPPMEAARLTREIAEAVEYAHTNGIIHRDLKPGNIILNGKGEPVITDFGLARQLDEETQAVGDDILGTPAYMAPEQARGRTAETDARSDVYSIGAILYAMLTGEDPFSGSSLLETLHKVIHDKPAPPEKFDPQIDVAISAICMKALSKDPKKRQQSAAELAADLGRYLQVLASATVSSTAAPAATRPGLFARLFAKRNTT